MISKFNPVLRKILSRPGWVNNGQNDFQFNFGLNSAWTGNTNGSGAVVPMVSLSSWPYVRDNSSITPNVWPLNAKSRIWNIVGVSSPNPQLVTLENSNIGTDKLVLWYYNNPGYPVGTIQGELFRKQGDWLFHVNYIDRGINPTDSIVSVVADECILTVGEVVTDLMPLISPGVPGHPYHMWNNVPAEYRIQVWGHLLELESWIFYWDAIITKDVTAANPFLGNANSLRVREAFWRAGWGLGSGDVDGSGLPNGNNMTYGRTVYHAETHLPYYMFVVNASQYVIDNEISTDYIDIILEFENENAARAVFGGDGNGVVFDIDVWRVSENILGVPQPFSGYWVLVSGESRFMPGVLKDYEETRLVINRTKANEINYVNQVGAVIKTTYSNEILQDIMFSPVPSGSNYPFGEWQ